MPSGASDGGPVNENRVGVFRQEAYQHRYQQSDEAAGLVPAFKLEVWPLVWGLGFVVVLAASWLAFSRVEEVVSFRAPYFWQHAHGNRVSFDVPESQIGSIREGQGARLVFGEGGRGRGGVCHGTVGRVDSRNGTWKGNQMVFRVEFVLDDPGAMPAFDTSLSIQVLVGYRRPLSVLLGMKG